MPNVWAVCSCGAQSWWDRVAEPTAAAEITTMGWVFGLAGRRQAWVRGLCCPCWGEEVCAGVGVCRQSVESVIQSFRVSFVSVAGPPARSERLPLPLHGPGLVWKQ